MEPLRAVTERVEELPKLNTEEVSAPELSPETEAPSFADLFGMEPTSISDKQREKLALIVAWARESNPGASREEIRWAIVQKKNSLGAPAIGSSNLDKLHRWVIAYRGFKSAESELKAMEGI